MEQAPPPTGHVGEEQDALVEPVGEQLISQLLEDCHPDAEREGRVAEQQGVPKVQDLVQGKDVWKKIKQGVPKKSRTSGETVNVCLFYKPKQYTIVRSHTDYFDLAQGKDVWKEIK